MRLKLLLFSFIIIVSSIIHAQEDTIRTLMFTEWGSGGDTEFLIEITNVGDEPVEMTNFKLGKLSPYGDTDPIYDLYNDPWVSGNWLFFPQRELKPGESFVICGDDDYRREQYFLKNRSYNDASERPQQPELVSIADMVLYRPEPNGDATDSVTTFIPNSRDWSENVHQVGVSWHGRSGLYLEQHFENGDSVVVDQVNGVFDDDGKNQGWGGGEPDRGYDVAGVSNAGLTHYLIRKNVYKTGNLDFNNARGVDIEDSEWIPIIKRGSTWRDVYWTVGNHGNYNLNENTLESDVVDVDLANKVITVPWGIRRGDGIMRSMIKKPGIAWEYHLNPNVEDSLYHSCQTGDKLTIYVCGDDLDLATFDIKVEPPTADANIVVPVSNMDQVGWYQDDTEEGHVPWPRVTQNASGVDSITGDWFGIPYATRVDSLVERLEKPADANWKFVWVDGQQRVDLKNGDILRVTAENGNVKDYFIQVQEYQPDDNAYLSAITWPDIPEFYRGIFGWIGDTLPNFNKTTYNYKLQIPLDVDGIPALVPLKEDLNSTIVVSRATAVVGTVENRTIIFKVTAEDGLVVNEYKIELIKEKNPLDIQPYEAEPFLSEFVFWDQWDNCFAEICNPGNVPLDLSNYLIAMHWSAEPANALTWDTEPEKWTDRYHRYVPGYKWVDEAQWQITPAILVQDLNINPIVMPGDVFVLGDVRTDAHAHPSWIPDFEWTVPDQVDIHFNNFNDKWKNPWDEEVLRDKSPVRKWKNSNWYLFKILNDSIKQGLKPATDINDFLLIEAFGMPDGTDWSIGGWTMDMTANVYRKPNIYKANPLMGASFGTTAEDSEWEYTDRAYWQAKNVGWPMEILNVANDIGQHYMNTPTQYMSTVSSLVYKVSEGYSMNEEIRGMITGTSVSDFFSNIIKPNEHQTLTITSVADGSELTMDALLTNGDTLTVISVDSTNTTKYLLLVSEDGLSSDALITSVLYDVSVESMPKSSANSSEDGKGNITGFEYGTQLKTILANIDLPAGANLTVIDGEGAYVSQKRLNYDTTYVFVTVNDNTYLDVLAENGKTRIVYQLQPEASQSAVFVMSDVYSVKEQQLLIDLVPRGTSVQTFISNLVPVLGASMKLVDKKGIERIDGTVADDDKIIITSANGMVTNTYYISKLASEYVPETTYLAYILSNIYGVDQVNYVVNGVSGSATIAEFYARIELAEGATAVVVDKNGVEKTSGDIDGSDMVKVTSMDGKHVVIYSFGMLTSGEWVQGPKIEWYPNPTNGKLNIKGLEKGQRIQVFNTSGVMIRNMRVQRTIESITLEDQPTGIYFFVINVEDKIAAQFKVIKK